MLSADSIDLGSMRQSLERREAGAVVVFEGTVRDHHAGRSVLRLEYSAHRAVVETAWQDLQSRALADFDVVAIRARHRIGALGIRDCAVWVGVAAAHRVPAFAACQWLIDAIKRELPIWKREHYADGTVEWRHDVVEPRKAAIAHSNSDMSLDGAGFGVKRPFFDG